MPVLPGAEPYTHDGGPVGVLLCHGFTGSPQSLRPWAEYLAEAGLSVSLPRLPGHGTTWQEMAGTQWGDWYGEIERAFEDLAKKTTEVFAMGLSLGSCLALRLAEVHGSAVRGLALVNPYVTANSRLFVLSPVLKHLVPSVKGVGSDIKKDGARELAYGRVPVKAAASLPQLWRLTRAGLGGLAQPVLVYVSPEDHVVGPENLAVLRGGVPAGQLSVRTCDNSYHVATLDNDAPAIFAGSLEFVRTHSHAEGG